ncbi:MAG: signal peptide peptidase SppA [Alphaproteobacteria bacterium]|nr:signal peptide peptidase SppA [Alphaproteobacteria bacterium]
MNISLPKFNLKYTIIRIFAVIGFVMTLSIASGAYMTWSYLAGREIEAPKIPDSMVLKLDFTAPIVERPQGFSFALSDLLSEETQTPIMYITRALNFAKDDPRVKAIYAKFGPQQPSLVYTQEIAKELQKLREKGKATFAYADSYGDFSGTANSYLLASYFDQIWVQPIGVVGLGEKNIEAPFGKEALARLGITTDFMRRAEYKSVMESFSQDSFSEPVKENMTAMLDSLNSQTSALLAGGRKISIEQANGLLKAGPYTTKEAQAKSLVTTVGYEDEIVDLLQKQYGEKTTPVSPDTYLYFKAREREKIPAKGTIALIYAEGMITDTPDSGPSHLADSDVMATEEITKAFRQAAKDEDVKAILFRVNSPGGSPVASEKIRRALIKAKESKKPVYVSMGRVAASGGYWISMNADKIFADPATITGSIGVVAGKFVMGGLFDKIGITWDTVGDSQQKSLNSVRSPFDEVGRERMNAMLDETYKAFTDNVAAARKIPVEKMPELAKGRVYTGEQAVKIGLVDELGGLDDAVDALKKELKVSENEKMWLQQFPPEETPEMFVLRLLKRLQFGSAMFYDFASKYSSVLSAAAPLIHAATTNGQVRAELPYGFLPLAQ